MRIATIAALVSEAPGRTGCVTTLFFEFSVSVDLDEGWNAPTVPAMARANVKESFIVLEGEGAEEEWLLVEDQRPFLLFFILKTRSVDKEDRSRIGDVSRCCVCVACGKADFNLALMKIM